MFIINGKKLSMSPIRWRFGRGPYFRGRGYSTGRPPIEKAKALKRPANSENSHAQHMIIGLICLRNMEINVSMTALPTLPKQHKTEGTELIVVM